MSDRWQDEREWYNDRTFEAVISKEEIDKQKDLIRMVGLEKVMGWFVKYGVIHYKHSFINFGEPLAWRRNGDEIEIKAGAHTNYEGCFPIYDWIWDQVKKYYAAEIPGFMSIGGQKIDPQLKCDSFTGACYNEIKKLGIFEASWVGASPANSGAAVTRVNMMAKSASDEDNLVADALLDTLIKQDLIQTPFGPRKDWDACMAEMRQQYDEETAEKICGKLKARLEKREVVPEGEAGLNKKMEESKDKEVKKQEEGEPAAAPPAEENPVAMVMQRIEQIEARLSALEEKAAPEEGEGMEAKAAPATGDRPGEVKVSIKGELEELMKELPTLVKGAVQELFEANKIVTKSTVKPTQGGAPDSGSLIAQAIEEAKKATSAREFFGR